MSDRRGSVTRRGLLWAGGLAAPPIAPIGPFSYPSGGMPWDSRSPNIPTATTKPALSEAPSSPKVVQPAASARLG